MTCNVHYGRVCFIHVQMYLGSTVQLLRTCSSVTGVEGRRNTLCILNRPFSTYVHVRQHPHPCNRPMVFIIISQLVRYARICISKVDFVNKLHRLSLHRKQQGFKYTLSSNPLTNSSGAMGSSLV